MFLITISRYDYLVAEYYVGLGNDWTFTGEKDGLCLLGIRIQTFDSCPEFDCRKVDVDFANQMIRLFNGASCIDLKVFGVQVIFALKYVL